VFCYYPLPNGFETLDDDRIKESEIIDNKLYITFFDKETIIVLPVHEETNEYNIGDWDIIDSDGYTEEGELIEVVNIIKQKEAEDWELLG
jgi:hypothetical protein